MSTRKAIAALFAASLLATAQAANAQATRANTPAPVGASALSTGDPSRFSAVFAKAGGGGGLTVGFLGGSITKGFAAHDDAHRYSDRIVAWFCRRFPSAVVTQLNAGVGGTGSHFGSLRAERDLLIKRPDVVVIEFAVNDEANEQSARTLEGIVRQVLSAPGSPACLLLFMSHDGKNAQQWHARVGQHYGLPMVSYRDGLAAEISAGRLKWSDVSVDDIHPNDRGHALAASYVESMLDAILNSAPKVNVAPSGLPPPLFTDLYARVDYRTADELRPTQNTGWAYDAESHSWRADRPGSSIQFDVDSRGVAALFYRVHKDMGRVLVRIDDRPPQTLDGFFLPTWGGYCHVADLATDLSPGRHSVRFELLTEKDDASHGHEFRLMGLAGLGVTQKRER